VIYVVIFEVGDKDFRLHPIIIYFPCPSGGYAFIASGTILIYAVFDVVRDIYRTLWRKKK